MLQTKVKLLFQSTKHLTNEKQAQQQKEIYKRNNLKRRKNITISPRRPMDSVAEIDALLGYINSKYANNKRTYPLTNNKHKKKHSYSNQHHHHSSHRNTAKSRNNHSRGAR